MRAKIVAPYPRSAPQTLKAVVAWMRHITFGSTKLASGHASGDLIDQLGKKMQEYTATEAVIIIWRDDCDPPAH